MSSDTIQHQDMEAVLGHIRVLRWILGGICAWFFAVAIAAIPWAMSVQANIARIQTKLEGFQIPPEWFEEDVRDNTRRIVELEKRVVELERRRQP